MLLWLNAPWWFRADSAGCTEGFLTACRARNVEFFVTARSNPQVTAAIDDAEGLEQVCLTALDRKGKARDDGSAVVELTSLINNDKLPEGTSLIVRREPLHPGAQRSLFPSLEFRYWASTPTRPVTSSTSTPPCAPTPTSNNTSPG